MTPEQQQLVRYAEAMGFGRTCVVRGKFQVCRDGSGWSPWNPLTDANDALELAEKMEIQFVRQRNGKYVADIVGVYTVVQKTLPAAICAAVDAALEKPVEPRHLEGL